MNRFLKWMKRLLCRLFGHDMTPVEWNTRRRTYSMRCIHCGHIWR
jgi:hypothetical protein